MICPDRCTPASHLFLSADPIEDHVGKRILPAGMKETGSGSAMRYGCCFRFGARGQRDAWLLRRQSVGSVQFPSGDVTGDHDGSGQGGGELDFHQIARGERRTDAGAAWPAIVGNPFAPDLVHLRLS